MFPQLVYHTDLGFAHLFRCTTNFFSTTYVTIYEPVTRGLLGRKVDTGAPLGSWLHHTNLGKSKCLHLLGGVELVLVL